MGHQSFRDWCPVFIFLMKTAVSVILLVCLSPKFANGQNLVLNPGFEEYAECPTFYTGSPNEFNDWVINWMTYFATTDYLNLCGFHGDPPDYPRSGAGCARIISYKITPVGGVSYREYLHGTLSEPLKADSIYYVEFYVRPSQKPPADEISYISDYHLHFSVNPIDTIGTTDWVLRLEPHISNQNGIDVLLLGAESSDAMNYDEGAVYAFPLEAP